MLDDARGARLVRLAREVIKEVAGGPRAIRPVGLWCEQPGATFVTLRRNGVLHGCIGSVEARRPLIDDVSVNAVSAAFLDPRATPLALEDVDDLIVELSVLSELTPYAVTDEASAIAALRPRIDGVVFRCDGRQSTFLPQVWDDLPNARDFLRQLKRKAGFSADFWCSRVTLHHYSLRKWIDAPTERAPAAIPTS